MTAATGLVLAVIFRDNLWLMVLSFTLSQIGQRSVQGVFWAIPPVLSRRHRGGRMHQDLLTRSAISAVLGPSAMERYGRPRAPTASDCLSWHSC
jgi:hypothetical protein